MTHEEIKKAFEFFYLSNDLTFDKKKHQYKLGGVTCAGISSISEYRPKDYLKFWAAKMVVEYLKDKQKEIKKMSVGQYTELLLEAKKQHTQRSKGALQIGTDTHDWMESYIKGKTKPITKDIEHPVNEFLDFERKHKVRWVCVEKIVCSPTHLVAGRLDSLAFVDDRLSLLDFKTSNQIDEGYFLQTGGYQMCLDEMGIPVEQRIILRLPKTKEDHFEAVLVNTDYEKDKEAFLHLRYAWQWDNYIDCNFKEEVVEKGYKVRKLKLLKI